MINYWLKLWFVNSWADSLIWNVFYLTVHINSQRLMKYVSNITMQCLKKEMNHLLLILIIVHISKEDVLSMVQLAEGNWRLMFSIYFLRSLWLYQWLPKFFNMKDPFNIKIAYRPRRDSCWTMNEYLLIKKNTVKKYNEFSNMLKINLYFINHNIYVLFISSMWSSENKATYLFREIGN